MSGRGVRPDGLRVSRRPDVEGTVRMSNRTAPPDGAKVRKLRISRGWTHEKLAHAAKCHKRTIENIEAGRAALLGTLSGVADALGVKCEDLFLASAIGTRENAGVEHESDLTEAEVDLRSLSPGPKVPDEWIPTSLIEAYTDMLSDRAPAEMLLLTAARLRLAADPKATVVRRAHIVEFGENARRFWYEAFMEANKHGPPMVAALIYAYRGPLSDEARRDRDALLVRLRDVGRNGT